MTTEFCYLIGFTGRNCNIQLIDCTNNICDNNGSCIAEVTSDGEETRNYCECSPYFTGDHCEMSFDPCANKCENNGTCKSSFIGNGEYNTICNCTEYFTGENCTVDIEAKILTCSEESVCGGSERRSNCINHENHNDYQCVCKFGYAGDRCEIDVDLCENSPCENGGTCEDHGSNFTCNCPPGYDGHTCSRLFCKDDTLGRLLVSCPVCTVDFISDHTT